MHFFTCSAYATPLKLYAVNTKPYHLFPLLTYAPAGRVTVSRCAGQRRIPIIVFMELVSDVMKAVFASRSTVGPRSCRQKQLLRAA